VRAPGFVVAGVFAMADHDLLGADADDDESTHDGVAGAGIRRAQG